MSHQKRYAKTAQNAFFSSRAATKFTCAKEETMRIRVKYRDICTLSPSRIKLKQSRVISHFSSLSVGRRRCWRRRLQGGGRRRLPVLVLSVVLLLVAVGVVGQVARCWRGGPGRCVGGAEQAAYLGAQRVSGPPLSLQPRPVLTRHVTGLAGHGDRHRNSRWDQTWESFTNFI